MSIILFYCNTTSTASSIVSDVEAGELFGVDMGTTSKASSYSRYALVECTQVRAASIQNENPDNETMEICLLYFDADSFSDAATSEKAWYLRGKLP